MRHLFFFSASTRRLLGLLVFFLALAGGLGAQIANPVRWSFRSEALGNDEFNLIATARIDAGWAVYSKDTGDGPVPTTFSFTEGGHYQFVGSGKEAGQRKAGFDKLFDSDVIKFLSGKPYTYTQRVRITDYSKPITGSLEYMCCDDEQCLPPTDVPFSYQLTKPAAAAPVEAPKPAGKTEQGNATAPPAKPATPATPQPAAPNTTGRAETAATPTPTPAEPTAAGTLLASAEQANLAAADVLLQPVRWTVRAYALPDPQTFRLEFTADLEKNWTLYGMDNSLEIGFIPTEFSFTPSPGMELLQPLRESTDHLKNSFDPVWEATVNKHTEGPVTYTQVVRLGDQATLDASVYYMSCDDEQCTPPQELYFRFRPAGPVLLVSDDPNFAAAAPEVAAGDEDVAPGLGIVAVAGLPTFDTTPVNTECGDEAVVMEGKSLWTIFGLGFIGGLLALLTPCVFPMIPLTVSFFTKSAKNRSQGISHAATYGFFILLVYVLLSLPFHLIAGVDAGILNQVAASVPLNVFFFLVFLFFAGSFFGFYELTIPDKWTNRAARAEGAGGLVGIFFMALTLALVSFSCTGPILGSLLVGAASSGAWPLTAGMAGFGLALALPFTVFAIFPNLMQSLPKSGGWLNSVKVVLGFVEIALAFKFLSNADLVASWDLLRIEPFLIIWILCGLGIVAYLLGLIRFPHDGKRARPGVVRYALAAAFLAFTVYLATGFGTNAANERYQPLTLLSGIAPPVCYSYFKPCDCPRELDCFHDLEEGLAFAASTNRPVMLDFTGYTCVNCRKMEENVWSVPEVEKLLQDNYVLISLYADDKKELPVAKQVEVPAPNGRGTKQLKLVRDRVQYLQAVAFQRNTQPYYVLVSPDGKVLNTPVAYTPDVQEYLSFLECGLSAWGSYSSGEVTRPDAKLGLLEREE
ncbi:MAG: cytochrome c biogenesis protein CcdA [Saprospiraceae bacterium]